MRGAPSPERARRRSARGAGRQRPAAASTTPPRRGTAAPQKRPGASCRHWDTPQAAGVPSRLTLVPIWFPHCPAWMCTISLMAMPRFSRRRTRFCAAPAARSPLYGLRGGARSPHTHFAAASRPTAGAPRARSANGRPQREPPSNPRRLGATRSLTSASARVLWPLRCLSSPLCFPPSPCLVKMGMASSLAEESCPCCVQVDSTRATKMT